LQLIDNVSSTGQRLGGTAEVQVGEGRQDAPVGTTIALIEQAQKIESAVHKRLHAAQSEELQILKELLQEDPEALWRHRRKGANGQHPWNEDSLRAALENYDLIPVADPNTPSHMHRMARAEAFAQKVSMNPQMFDMKAVYQYYFQSIGMADADRFFAPPMAPQANQIDPVIVAAQSAHQIAQMKAQTDAQNAQLKAQSDAQAAQMKAAAQNQSNQIKLLDIQSRAQEGQANRQSKEQIEKLKIAERLAVHPLSQSIIAGQQPPGAGAI
jgi:hypothetical protein